MRSYHLLLALALIQTQGASSQVTPANDLQTSLTKMITRLEAEKKTAKREDKYAFDAAIDSLVRLRDRHTWPIINSPVANGTLQNTTWEIAPDAGGPRQELHFAPMGGTWLLRKDKIPMGISWTLESNRIRISTLDSFKEPFNYQTVDRTYIYEIKGDTLTLKRGDDVQTWKRVEAAER